MTELPPVSMANHGTLIRHGFQLGELFAFYGVHRIRPEGGGQLVRAQAHPDRPARLFDLVDEGSGKVFATYGWRQAVWAVGFLAPGQQDHFMCPGWRAPMPIDEVVRLSIIEHREAGRS